MAKTVTFGGQNYDLDTPEGLSSFLGASGGAGVSNEAKQGILDAAYERELGGGMSKAELKDFETLVGRLESSKMRQAGQANRARQRDTFAGGLASMMGNF